MVAQRGVEFTRVYRRKIVYQSLTARSVWRVESYDGIGRPYDRQRQNQGNSKAFSEFSSAALGSISMRSPRYKDTRVLHCQKQNEVGEHEQKLFQRHMH